MDLLNIVLFFALLATCCAEVAKYSSCTDDPDDICKITSLDITPCKDGRCVIRRKMNASITFDYTPNFNASNLESAIYWVSPTGDIPFAGMESNGCIYTTCPVSAGKPGTLNYKLRIGSKVPLSTYLLKFKLKNKDDSSQLCCFRTTILIKK